MFEAMFPEDSFTQDNPVSVAMEKVLATFDENEAFAREREPLDAFYSRVTDRIRKLDSVHAKRQMLVTLYDKFFTRAIPVARRPHGHRVYAGRSRRLHPAVCGCRLPHLATFRQRLSDEGVNILEPFAGTGVLDLAHADGSYPPRGSVSEVHAGALRERDRAFLQLHRRCQHRERVPRMCAENGVEPVVEGFEATDRRFRHGRARQIACRGVFPEEHGEARETAQRQDAT